MRKNKKHQTRSYETETKASTPYLPIMAGLVLMLIVGLFLTTSSSPDLEDNPEKEKVGDKTKKPATPDTKIVVKKTEKITVDENVTYASLKIKDLRPTPSDSEKLERKGMAIIVPSFLKEQLTNLDKYVVHKKKLGLKPVVVTESDFGGGTGREAALNIRKWLKANKTKYDLLYVMFIGDPHPERGEVPMKMLADPYGGKEETTPTDFFYVDLTGTFDHNENDVYGEPDDYEKYNGMDCKWDVLVGRIPCYRVEHGGQGAKSADEILLRTIKYEQEADIRWRYNFVITSFNAHWADLFDKKQVDYVVTLDHENRKTDSFKNRVLDVEHLGNLELINTVTPGFIRVGGHGTPTFCGGLETKQVLREIQRKRPSVLQFGGCSVAHPEAADNLTFALLRSGSIGVVGGARSVTGWTTWLRGKRVEGLSPTEMNVGGRCFKENCSVGYSLWQTNKEISMWASGNISATALLENLYGDPSVHPFPYNKAPYVITIEPNHLKIITVEENPPTRMPAKLHITNNSDKPIKVNLSSSREWLFVPGSIKIAAGAKASADCAILGDKIDGGGNHLAQIRLTGNAGIDRIRNVQVFKKGPPKQAPEGNQPPQFNRTFIKTKVLYVKDFDWLADLKDAFTDPEGERLLFEASNVPSWIIVHRDGRLQTPYGPPAEDHGITKLQIKVSDPYDASVTAEVILGVINKNEEPSILSEQLEGTGYMLNGEFIEGKTSIQSNLGWTNSPEKMLNDDLKSFAWTNRRLAIGDWITVHYPEGVLTGKLQLKLITGIEGKQRDRLKRGAVEISSDGKTFKFIGEVGNGKLEQEIDGPIRSIRLRIINEQSWWLAIPSFYVKKK